jgi:hypothetical protein
MGRISQHVDIQQLGYISLAIFIFLFLKAGSDIRTFLCDRSTFFRSGLA